MDEHPQKMLVVLDEDPLAKAWAPGVPVLTRWKSRHLIDEFARDLERFVIFAPGISEDDAPWIAADLRKAADESGVEFDVAIREDSDEDRFLVADSIARELDHFLGFVVLDDLESDVVAVTRREVMGPLAPPVVAGIVIVGWAGGPREEELISLLALPNVAPLDVSIAELTAGGQVRRAQIRDAMAAAEVALQHGYSPVLYVEAPGDESDRRIEIEGLVAIVAGIERRPGFVLVAGSALATEIASDAFGARRLVSVGQLRPEINAWRLGDEARFPHLPVIVANQSEGRADSIGDVFLELRGDRRPPGVK